MWILEETADPGENSAKEFPAKEVALAAAPDDEIRASLDSTGYADATPEGSTGRWSFHLYERA